MLSHWRTHLFYRNLHTVKTRSWSYSNERHLTAVVVLFHINLWRMQWIISATRHFSETSQEHDKNTFLQTLLKWRRRCAQGLEARSGGKKELALWRLSRCLQSGLYSQRTLYSCINAFQDAGAWFAACLTDCFPPFQWRVLYILTLKSAEADKSCWIGYLTVPQGHMKQHVCFSSEAILKFMSYKRFNLYM